MSLVVSELFYFTTFYSYYFIPVNDVFGRQIVFSVAMMVEGRQRWEEDKKRVMEGRMETQDWRLSSSVWQ